MKQITIKLLTMIIACIMALALFGTFVMADELPEQEAAENETDDGKVWDMYTAGIKMDIPEGFITYKDRIEAFTDFGTLDEGIVYAEVDMFLKSREELEAMTEDEYYEEMINMVPLTLFIGMDGGRGEVEFNAQQKMLGNDIYFNFEQIGEAAGYTFYNVTYEMEDVVIEDEELLAIVDEIKEQIKECEKNIVFSEPSDYRDGARLSFVTEDLEGNEVKSEDIFSANKITMVNLWTSWCTWCIKEMPELEELNRELNEQGCCIIGIQVDSNEAGALEEGKEVLEMAGVTYLNLKTADAITDTLLIQAYPSTYFVDSEGYLVGEPVIGADLEAYKEQITKLLEEME